MGTLADLYKIASEEKDRSSVVMPALEGTTGAVALGAAGVAGKKAVDKAKAVKESKKAMDENKKTVDALLQRAQNERAMHGELGKKLTEAEKQNAGVLNKIKDIVTGGKAAATKEDILKNKKAILGDVMKSYAAADALKDTNKQISEFAKANKKAGILYGLGAAGLTAAGIGLGAHAGKSFIGEQNN